MKGTPEEEVGKGKLDNYYDITDKYMKLSVPESILNRDGVHYGI